MRETWAKISQAEPLKFTLDDSQLEAYLGEMDLSVKSHLDEKDIQERHLSNKRYENLGKLAGWLRFVTAKGQP